MQRASIGQGENKMRTTYNGCDYPGTYEHESPMVEYIDTNDYYDETSGDVESPTGWYGIAGKWIITQSSQGFVYGHKFSTRQEAADEYAALENAYWAWSDPWDDGQQ